jgi:hypothetical protein
MANSHLIALHSQELSALLRASSSPQYVALFAQISALRATGVRRNEGGML